jgi:predicted extracellular nuclease
LGLKMGKIAAAKQSITMKNIRLIQSFLMGAIMLFSLSGNAQSDLIITAVYDGPLTGGTPKGVELYAINDIPDLSIYALGSANNGGGTDGEEFIFPSDAATEGEFIYVASEEDQFLAFFGFNPDYTSGAMSINGDDAIELFLNGTVVDLYGDINVDGSGQTWEYADSWAYRANGSSPGTSFSTSDWIIPGPDALDGASDNATASQPVPVGTFDPDGGTTITVYTIYEIQETTDPSGDSPVVGELVETSGIVTAVGNDGFWIQDPMGGPWSGIFVLDPSTIAAQGDDVTVQGSVQESFDLTRISASSVAVNSSGNPVPSAELVSVAVGASEAYESVLIRFNALICVNPDAGFGEYVLSDGSDELLVDDLLFPFTPTLFAEYEARGVMYFSFGDFKLLPRDADDIEDTGNNQLILGFAETEADILEGSGAVSYAVQIINPTISSTSVDVVVTGGTATNGVDYSFSPTTLTFPASSGADQNFTVTINDNGADDGNRTIEFGLANPTNGALLIPDAFELTILDDEVSTTDIATVAAVDADGVAINEGQEFTILGRVLGGNLSGSGVQFTVIDQTGGIGIFNQTPVSGYSPVAGDDVVITGVVDQFNGLTQLNPTSIILQSQGNPLPAPTQITELNEDTESQLVVFTCATLVDPAQWTNSGSGFNVDVTDGVNTITVRVDNNVDLYNQPAPTGEFDIVGIGGQFDTSNPFTSGYQLLPRSSADVLPSSCAGTPAQVSLLTLPCGGEIIQVTNAAAGPTDGGVATDETRTIYAYQPDMAGGTPTYTGANWPYVLVPNGFNADPNISANLSVGPGGILLINGWPAYQFVNDLNGTDANGNFGPWFYFEPDGNITQDACPFVCENPFPAVDEASLSTTVLSNKVVLEWAPVPNQIGCQVRVRRQGVTGILGSEIRAGETASMLQVPFSLLNPGQSYEWQVRCGCSQSPLVAGPFSPWLPFTIPSGLVINNSPNPTEGLSNVTFSVNVNAPVTLEVYDVSGRKIAELFNGVASPESEYRFEFDGSDLPNGVYLYRLTSAEQVTTEKFLIAR